MHFRSVALASTLLLGSLALLGLGTPDGAPSSSPKAVPTPVIAKPTYAANVATILNRECVPCHRPGEVAPFSLVGYENAKKWAPMIASVTEAKRMPPWKSTDAGVFHDERRLTADEIQLLKDWAETSAPRGDRKKEPKLPTDAIKASDWRLGTPNVVLKPTKAYKLAAEGSDEYRYFVLRNPETESRWVNGVEFKVGNPKIVHHIIAFVDRTGVARKAEKDNKDGQEGYSFDGGPNFFPSLLLGVWAPGNNPRMLPEQTAFELKPGSDIVLQVHYNRTGKAEKDLSSIGLYFSSEPPKQRMNIALLDDLSLSIKAGDPAYKKATTLPIPGNATIYGVMPHMHRLGKSMNADLLLPGGEVKRLIRLPDWDFNWQMLYWYKQPIKVSPSSKLKFIATYDNSKNNPRNPHNPPQNIEWGEATTSEMSMLIVAYGTDRK